MKEILRLALRLGILGFGGPIAVVGMMEEEAARKRNWLTSEHFTEMFAVLKLFPGPLATQMMIYLGFIRGGTLGGLLAGIVFILPSFFIVLAMSILYVSSSAINDYSWFFSGMQVGALVVILISALFFAKPFRTRKDAWIIGSISAAIMLIAPSYEPLVIFGWGLFGALRVRPGVAKSVPGVFSLSLSNWLGTLPSALDSIYAKLFWSSFKAGAFVFGTGLAIVPLLEADAVQKHHWLTHAEFMDGLAFGQITPGPVVITTTFIGYKAAGLWGAIISSVGIFLPCFFNVLVVLPRTWSRFRASPVAAGFSAWAVPAVVGCILGTSLRLGWLTLTTPMAWVLFAVSMAVAYRFKPPAWMIIPLAGVGSALLRAVF